MQEISYQSTSLTSPVGLVLTLLLWILVLVLPPRYTFLPFIAGACFITGAQRIIIAGLDFTMIRLLAFAGVLRLVLRRDFHPFRPNKLDWLFFSWVVVGAAIYSLRQANFIDLINRLGFVYDMVGLYLIARAYVGNFSAFESMIKGLMWMIIPVGFAMLIEATTGRNWFYLLGGSPALSEIRDGHVRCQGPFAHAIMAGTYGATSLFLFVAFWHKNRGKIITGSAIIAAGVITITARSSGALMAAVLGVIGLLLWPYRQKMRKVRIGLVLALIILHFSMKAPVWFLIARISELVGGSGWHRAELIDQCLNHISEWWFMGTSYTAHWMESVNPSNPNMIDITNWFVGQATSGGLVTLTLFISIFIASFSKIGSAIAMDPLDHVVMTKVYWCLGCGLLAHVASMISVAYFDQIVVFWLLLLAFIAAPLENVDLVLVGKLEKR